MFDSNQTSKRLTFTDDLYLNSTKFDTSSHFNFGIDFQSNENSYFDDDPLRSPQQAINIDDISPDQFIRNNSVDEASDLLEYKSDSQTKNNLFDKMDSKKKGRKKKKDKENGIKGKHDKYSQENLLRKAKVMIFKSVMETINNEISSIDGSMKRLKSLKYDQKMELKVENNKKLLNEQIKDIFRTDISSKYKHVKNDYNKRLIIEIYKEKEKMRNVINILDKTFRECLKEIINGEKSMLRENFNKYYNDTLCNQTDRYKNDFMSVVRNYESIYKEIKKPRKSRGKTKI